MWACEFGVASVPALFARVVGWSFNELFMEGTGAEAGEACLWGGAGINWGATAEKFGEVDSLVLSRR